MYPNKGKIAALDLGEKWIGVAVTDFDQGVVFRRDEWQFEDDETFLKQLSQWCEAEQIAGILVGLPLNLSGSDSTQTGKIKDLYEKIKQHLDLPLETMDERFSSKEADKKIQKGSRNDSEAAAILLETYLSSKTSTPGSELP